MDRPIYDKAPRCTVREAGSSSTHRDVYLALGSNLGDRGAMIEAACQSMTDGGIRVLRTSHLYETEPMYVEDQDKFLNGVCQVETNLSPTDLLVKIQDIEKSLGRVKLVDKGPRSIDIDILLYGNERVELEHLCIPHKGISEREFVLRPLCDLIPDAILPSKTPMPSFRTLLHNLPTSSQQLSPTTPICPALPPILSALPTKSTKTMAIMNMTLDSFSDGGIHTSDPRTLLPTLEASLEAGVSILDIGGQSTRPHAAEVTTEEELNRVIPTIKSIRSQRQFDKMAISIDTYRASVAAAAIEAGANIINDVSAGQMDPEMLPTVARLGCTVILMHMRGNPKTMNKLTSYPNGVLDGVGTELQARVAVAEEAGIRRWRIMLDPGIGFAKNEAQNLELLRRFAELRAFEGLNGFPWVVGASRKAFIGRITGVQKARERVWGTAGAVCAAVQGGADVLRVHDVREMGQVVKVADAIWRA
ncbi:MAG: hypothetical protein Q9191_007990 [Dirinaria sp. TL-2023a]